MFGMEQDIKRIYLECLEKPVFQSNFERKIGSLIKTKASRGSVDYNKLIAELRTIAQCCKERGYRARKFLEIITDFVYDASLGHHAEMKLNRETLLLEPPEAVKRSTYSGVAVV